MNIFEQFEKRDHEQVTFCYDRQSGLRAIIAIHNTTLGPALGGTRMWTYASDEDALRDVLRLSSAMTYKASIAGLNLGGGKAVILGDPHKEKSEVLFRRFGRFVEAMAGRYITAEDVGTDVRDMEYVRMETKYVTGISRALGGSGDPSPVTACGIYAGMKACAQERHGSDSLKGKRVAVQGLGHVGQHVCEHLFKEGAHLIVTDIYAEQVQPIVQKYGAEFVQPEAIYDVEADIFCPCALGGVINDDTISRLKCGIIAGAANNQLLDEKRHGQQLMERGILYAPDYAINAGGLINVAAEIDGYNKELVLNKVSKIYDTIDLILARAESEGILPQEAAAQIAEQRLQQASFIKKAEKALNTDALSVR